MRSVVKTVLILLVAVFGIIQFIRPDQTNPPTNPADTLEAATTVPNEVKQILNRSCNDCHTHDTVYPWYSQISPFSWFLDDHIRHGREELNFSIWNTYTPSRKENKLDELCEQVKQGHMPLPSYLWIHRDAVLRDGDVRILCEWADQVIRDLP